ncbi:MAG: type IX secretion system membrane protein PorP/SprF [Cyclobacteriaceae bacterium]|nr:type IX secretion system membrane protein PorP/SprF [Cyclobacteriaceae bacterium]
MKLIKLIFIYVFILFAVVKVTAQDAQYSQFYAAPLYLNPSLAGATGQTRMGINYRNQWPAINANFVTYSTYFDHFFEDFNSGVGMLLTNDREGLAGLNSIQAAIQYSYQLYLTNGLIFRPGLQAGYFHRSINFGALTFGDQFDPITGDFINPATAEQFNTGFSKGMFDFSAGGLFYTSNAWLGLAVHHLNRPVQSFYDPTDRLARKWSVHGGVKIPMTPKERGGYLGVQERSFTPTFQYKHQGPFDQFDLGVYFTLEPLILGTWYRGIPFKTVNGIMNNESIVLLVGFTQKGKDEVLNIGYSYDYTISGLGAASGGAHEFSLSYSWSMRDPRKPPKDVMLIPCPKF